MKASVIGVTLCLLVGYAGSGLASSAARLESIKQHALALYTVSVADQRQFSNTAVVLLQNHSPHELLRTRIYTNDALWAEYRYNRRESRGLRNGAAQLLGNAPLPAGQHQVRVEVQSQAPGTTQPSALSSQATLNLNEWPRGINIALTANQDGSVNLSIGSGISGPGLLDAANFELSNGRAGRALSQLQNLAQLAPGMTQQARYSLLLADGLRAWGLERAAEAMYFELSQSQSAGTLGADARLEAAELALARADADAADRYLQRPNDFWQPAHQGKLQILQQRVLIARQQLDRLAPSISRQAPAAWRFNLAIAMQQAGESNKAAALLDALGQENPTLSLAQPIRDLANIKLGYLHLQLGQGDAALTAFSRIGADSPQRSRARLGQGWASLLRLEPGNGGGGDGLRPAFASQIDTIMHGPASQRTKRKALLKAIAAWSELRDGDPLDPSVQEALVAIPYALALMGENARAASYGEIAVSRLEAVREALVKIHSRARRGQTLDAVDIAAKAWPPHAHAWQSWVDVSRWWQAPPYQVPELAHMPHLLTDPETLHILQAMTVLSDAETLASAAESTATLKQRAQQLRKRIAAERTVQQRRLNRFVWSWLDAQGKRTTRYLIMARLILGDVQGRMDKTP